MNQAILIGRVGKDPEISTANSTKLAKFSLATSEKYKDKAGQVQEQTEWHSVSIWGNLADVVEKYVKKGDKLFVQGKITHREYEKDGQKRNYTEIRCEKLEMLGSGQAQAASSQTAQQAVNEVESDDLPF